MVAISIVTIVGNIQIISRLLSIPANKRKTLEVQIIVQSLIDLMFGLVVGIALPIVLALGDMKGAACQGTGFVVVLSVCGTASHLFLIAHARYLVVVKKKHLRIDAYMKVLAKTMFLNILFAFFPFFGFGVYALMPTGISCELAYVRNQYPGDAVFVSMLFLGLFTLMGRSLHKSPTRSSCFHVSVHVVLLDGLGRWIYGIGSLSVWACASGLHGYLCALRMSCSHTPVCFVLMMFSYHRIYRKMKQDLLRNGDDRNNRTVQHPFVLLPLPPP